MAGGRLPKEQGETRRTEKASSVALVSRRALDDASQRETQEMALYKYSSYLAQSSSAAFDTIYSPGDTTPYSGIYRCEGCASEIASNAGNPLPSQNHDQHNPNTQGKIRWRLIVSC